MAKAEGERMATAAVKSNTLHYSRLPDWRGTVQSVLRRAVSLYNGVCNDHGCVWVAQTP